MDKRQNIELSAIHDELKSPAERNPKVADIAVEDAERFMLEVATDTGEVGVGYQVPTRTLMEYAENAVRQGRISAQSKEDYLIAFRDYCSGGTTRRDN